MHEVPLYFRLRFCTSNRGLRYCFKAAYSLRRETWPRQRRQPSWVYGCCRKSSVAIILLLDRSARMKIPDFANPRSERLMTVNGRGRRERYCAQDVNAAHQGAPGFMQVRRAARGLPSKSVIAARLSVPPSIEANRQTRRDSDKPDGFETASANHLALRRFTPPRQRSLAFRGHPQPKPGVPARTG